MSKIFGVIVTYKPDMVILEKCIHSLKNQLDKIIIVDNTPGSCEKLESFKTFPNIEVIYLKDNYTLGEKLGLKFTPPVIAISNSISICINKHTS